MKFSGKAALVVGAGGGMGLEIACQLIKRGVNVAMADIKPQPEDIADVIMLLAEQTWPVITGQQIPVDGGRTAGEFRRKAQT